MAARGRVPFCMCQLVCIPQPPSTVSIDTAADYVYLWPVYVCTSGSMHLVGTCNSLDVCVAQLHQTRVGRVCCVFPRGKKLHVRDFSSSPLARDVRRSATPMPHTDAALARQNMRPPPRPAITAIVDEDDGCTTFTCRTCDVTCVSRVVSKTSRTLKFCPECIRKPTHCLGDGTLARPGGRPFPTHSSSHSFIRRSTEEAA